MDEQKRASEQARFDNAFVYHAVKDGQQERYVKIRETAKGLAELIANNVPFSREYSIAITHLEDAVMWANAAIARNE